MWRPDRRAASASPRRSPAMVNGSSVVLRYLALHDCCRQTDVGRATGRVQMLIGEQLLRLADRREWRPARCKVMLSSAADRDANARAAGGSAGRAPPAGCWSRWRGSALRSGFRPRQNRYPLRHRTAARNICSPSFTRGRRRVPAHAEMRSGNGAGRFARDRGRGVCWPTRKDAVLGTSCD